ELPDQAAIFAHKIETSRDSASFASRIRFPTGTSTISATKPQIIGDILSNPCLHRIVTSRIHRRDVAPLYFHKPLASTDASACKVVAYLAMTRQMSPLGPDCVKTFFPIDRRLAKRPIAPRTAVHEPVLCFGCGGLEAECKALEMLPTAEARWRPASRVTRLLTGMAARQPDDGAAERKPQGQARPNVLFEAGTAM